MAFNDTNFLEDATQANNGDFLWYDRAGNVGDVAGANTQGEWCAEVTSTTSSGTGATANPSGRSGFISTEASGPVASTVWRVQRDRTFDTTLVNLVLNLRYSKSIENASEFYIEYATLASPNETTDWTILETITGTLGTSTWIDDAFDFSGVASSTTFRIRLRCNFTNAFTNDLCLSTWNEVGTDIAGVSSIDSSGYGALSAELDFDDTNVDINGGNFEATESTATCYLSPNNLLSEAGEVDISAAVSSWSDLEIGLDFSLLSQATVDSLHTMGPGARHFIVLTSTSNEYTLPVTVHRPVAFEMVAGLLVPGVTTSRITGMTGTFGGGRAEETAAQNPSTTLTDVADDGNREDLFSMQAKPNSVDGDTYDFRFLYGGVVAETITQTPQVTISAGTNHVALPGAKALVLAGKVLVSNVIHSAAPGIDAILLAGKVPEKIVNFIRGPPVETAVFAGQAPTLDYGVIDPPVDTLVLAGQAPIVLLNLSAAPAIDALVLAGQAPTVLRVASVAPAIDDLVLAGQAPVVCINIPEITSVNADAAWSDGAIDIEIVGINLV